MQFFSVMLLTVVGLLAADGWFVERFPQLQKPLQDIRPARALIGVAALVLGAVWFLMTLSALFSISFAPISVLLSLVGSGLLAGIGFMLAAPLMNEQLFKNNDDARKKVGHAREALEKYREKAGVLSVGVSLVLMIVFLAGVGV